MNLDLTKFCADENDPRYYLQQPFLVGNFVCATNGHIAVFTSGKAEEAEGVTETLKDAILKFYKKCKAVDYKDVQLPIEPNKTPCEQCSGTGKIERCYECGGVGEVELEGEYNIYNVDCKSCDATGILKGVEAICNYCNGDGWRYENDGCVAFDDVFINYRNFQIVKDLPELKFNFPSVKSDPVNFKFSNGYGVIMPMRT